MVTQTFHLQIAMSAVPNILDHNLGTVCGRKAEEQDLTAQSLRLGTPVKTLLIGWCALVPSIH